MTQKKPTSILIASWLISILIIITSVTGIFGKETYISDTSLWRVQSIGQDKINLFFIVPLLLLSGFKSYHKKINYQFIFGGSLLFLIYTFVIYCFTIHFNSLFIVYCALLGLTFYSFIYVLIHSWLNYKNHLALLHLPVKSIRGFLFIITSFFCFLWLREDVTAILLGMPPVSLKEAGLFTNPVHVLDLAIVLPGFIILAHLLKKGVSLGKLLVCYVLVFCILMLFNIGALLVMMNFKKPEFLAQVIGFIILPAAVAIFLLRILFHRFNMVNRINSKSLAKKQGPRPPNNQTFFISS
jgi:hypothetical protein